MPQASLAASHQEALIGETPKLCINMYAEKDGSLPGQESVLRSIPGATDADSGNVLTTGVRLLDQQQGFASDALLVLDGTTLRTRSSAGVWGTITGTVSGTDRAQIAYIHTHAMIVSGGGLYYSDGSTVQAVTDPDFENLKSNHGVTDFTSVTSLNQRFVFSYGDQISWTGVADPDDTTALSYYTAESSPDRLVGLERLGEIVLAIGEETVESWYYSGASESDPLSRVPGRTFSFGSTARDSIVSLGSMVMFVDQHRRVIKADGETADTQTCPNWVTRALDGVADADIKAYKWAHQGHLFYVLRLPSKCIAYDLTTDQWTVLKSYGSETWRFTHMARQNDDWFAASDGTELGLIDPDTYTEMGQAIVREWTAHTPQLKRGIRLSPTHMLGAFGVGTSDLEMAVSLDGGHSWSSYRPRSQGAIGVYDGKPRWNQCGSARLRPPVFKFRCSDAVHVMAADCRFGEAM